MARALIVGCGCRGRELGDVLRRRGWQVRGTTRNPENVADIEAAGIEAAIADPDRAITIVEQIEGVTLIFWLLGSAAGDADALEAIHGPRLARVLEEIVDTPVRGIVYEAAGSVAPRYLEEGMRTVAEAAETWHIREAIVGADPADREGWVAAMLQAAQRLVEA